ncbi:MAG: TA system VapC family ribonuclease toxin, partial [Myxococcota bacterium]
AYNSSSVHHDACRDWLERAFAGPAPVVLPWISVWAFLRISTNSRVFEYPIRLEEAREIVESWLEVDFVNVVQPGPRHWQILERVMSEARVVGPLVTDAVLAALAIEHGAAVCTTDRDFTRFDGIKVVDPTLTS